MKLNYTIAMFLIFMAGCTATSQATDYVSEWQYKLIVEEKMFVECTQTLGEGCITWNWVNSKDDIKLDGIIKINALSFKSNEGWDEVDGWMTVPEGGVNLQTDISTAAKLTYKLTILKAGTYYIWIRGGGADASSDSINYGINGVRTATITFLNRPWSNYTQYTNRKAILELVEGIHDLNIWVREDGVKIQEIQLTIDSEYKP
ncbi:MAG: hypothetical protein ACUZ8H_06745 [Candidatus Anammoxibacter sp.]